MSCSKSRVTRVLLVVIGSLIVASTAVAQEPQRLTTDGLLKRDTLFWPDGKELIYTVEIPSGRMKVVRLNLADGKSEFVHPDESLSDRELTVSADGQVYAYNVILGGKGIESQIRLTHLAQNKTANVPMKGWSHWPSVSPDGALVAFDENAQRIYTWPIDFDRPPPPEPQKGEKVDAQQQAAKAGLKLLCDEGYWPRFSPDGRQIAFCSRRDDDLEVYVMDADGGNQRRLTESRGIDAHPVFSPDGSRIAFTSNRDGNFEIYVMNADGSHPVRVTDHPERDDFPAWHPDGQRLAIISERDGAHDLYLVPVPE